MKLKYIIATLAICLALGAAAKPKARAKAPKITPEELLHQANTAFEAYDFDLALEKLEEYESAIQRTKKPLSDEYHSLMRRVQTGTDMLARVEDIVIIDTLHVSADDFFRFYRLSAPSGRIIGSAELPAEAHPAAGSTAYVTEDGETAIWSQSDNTGHSQLFQASKLVDGSWEAPHPLGDDLAKGADAKYPFLMSDGVTLYYASNGNGSLGGYDIFMTRNDGDRYLDPANVGMPYNSPANDYLMAIDELTGAGWWASDRDAPEGEVTIYVFMPRDVRKNYSIDREDLPSLAKIDYGKDQRAADPAAQEVIQRINELSSQSERASSSSDFAFALPDGSIARRMGDLRTVDGRRAMKAYLLYKAELSRTMDATAKLRARYSKGDRSVSDQILANEAKERQLRQDLKAKAAEVAIAEGR